MVVFLHKSVEVIWYKFLYCVELNECVVLILSFVIMNLELLELVCTDFRTK
jgi:hypothetical protein